MAKRVDPLKAKEAKQKKIAIVGAVLLVAVLAVQGPKTLKMLKGPQPAAQAASVGSGPGGPAAPAPAAGGPAAGAPASGVPGTAGSEGETPAAAAAPADLAAVADSDPAPEAEQGQLATFERFASKDPFAQQAQPVEDRAAAPAPPAAQPGSKTDEPKPVTVKPAAGDAAGGGTDGGFTTGGSTPVAPKLAEATSIAVNGKAENVALDGVFPADTPTFVLVSVAKDGKSIRIGIAGGSYASGDETLELALGKKLTLQNTADGSRYELELLAIEGFPLPKRK
jgi:hypothetical protein